MKRESCRSTATFALRILPFVFWTMVLYYLGPQALTTVSEIAASISRSDITIAPQIDVSVTRLYNFVLQLLAQYTKALEEIPQVLAKEIGASVIETILPLLPYVSPSDSDPIFKSPRVTISLTNTPTSPASEAEGSKVEITTQRPIVSEQHTN
jgi:hypothetical protein